MKTLIWTVSDTGKNTGGFFFFQTIKQKENFNPQKSKEYEYQLSTYCTLQPTAREKGLFVSSKHALLSRGGFF